MTEDQVSLPESVKLPFEANSHSITPYFRIESHLNVALSEETGQEVFNEPREMVELRFAGDRNYVPVVPADDMWRKHGNKVITYAERFSDQYQQFVRGDNQVAGGTALEALKMYGITPAQLSICRTLRIYSIEALHAIEGQNVKNLGMNANALKEMARRYMEEKKERQIMQPDSDLASLQAEIERLKALIPQETPTPDDVDKALAAADAEHEEINLTDEEIKVRISDLTGSRPKGNPSRTTLLQSLRELEGAA